MYKPQRSFKILNVDRGPILVLEAWILGNLMCNGEELLCYIERPWVHINKPKMKIEKKSREADFCS